jgi:cell division protein FtsL
MAKSAKKIQLVLFVLFWLILVSMFIGLTITQMSSYNYYRSELMKIQNNLQFEEDEYKNLLNQQEFYKSNAYIEQLARDRLNYVKPNEIVIINDTE